MKMRSCALIDGNQIHFLYTKCLSLSGKPQLHLYCSAQLVDISKYLEQIGELEARASLSDQTRSWPNAALSLCFFNENEYSKHRGQHQSTIGPTRECKCSNHLSMSLLYRKKKLICLPPLDLLNEWLICRKMKCLHYPVILVKWTLSRFFSIILTAV